MEKKIPHISSQLRRHYVEMPQEVWSASGIIIWGKRIKSLVFSTDLAIIRNCNADAVLSVYPFTPQQVIADAIIAASYIPVFCGVGGGITGGARVIALAQDAEAEGAMGVVVNAPIPAEIIRKMREVIDIPIVATVVNESTDVSARIDAGVSILNVSAAGRTPMVVDWIRKKHPDFPIIATGGPTGETIRQTISAGANAISITPPTINELFKQIMETYRDQEW
ncbi:MAG: hydrolase [Clostridia bacterium]